MFPSFGSITITAKRHIQCFTYWTRMFVWLARENLPLLDCTLASMELLMALSAESDEIFLGVVAQLAPPLNVMDLKIRRASTRSATPAVTLKDLEA